MQILHCRSNLKLILYNFAILTIDLNTVHWNSIWDVFIGLQAIQEKKKFTIYFSTFFKLVGKSNIMRISKYGGCNFASQVLRF